MPDPPDSRRGRPKGSASFPWRAFFQQADTPVFVLGKHRRLRFANSAWERLTGGKLADSLGLVCSTRRHSSLLAAAMAPTPEALAGQVDRSRRPAPAHRSGPPWWDVTFVPLQGSEGPIGIVGFVRVIGEAEPASARKIPPAVAALRDQHAHTFSLDLLAGESLVAERLCAQVRLAARTNVPVWLRGEAGSGKQTTARVIHQSGPQRERAFAIVDCEGLQPYLIEGLLFGHGGLAGSDRAGTTYVKEPAALPRDLQQRLYDWFTEGRPSTPRPVFGSIAASADDVRTGRLLPAFHSEFAAFEIELPPLRDRLEDLPRFLAHFLERSVVSGAAIPTIEATAMTVLRGQTWPGNLRELADAIAGAVERAGGGPVKREHLPHALRVRADLPPADAGEPSLELGPILEEVERRLIALALERTHHNQTRAAEVLGVTRADLGRRMKALGLAGEKSKPKAKKPEG